MARDGDNLAIGQRRMRREARAGKAKALPRSESAPTLAPVWEPGGDEVDELPWLAKPNVGADSRNSDDPPATPVPDADGRLTGQWQHLLERISASGGRSHLDLASTMRDGRPLQLRTGLLEQYYEMKRVLVEAKHFRVVEGIHRSTGRNHSLKIVSSRGRRRATRELDPIHAWHLIAALCARTSEPDPPPRARPNPTKPTGELSGGVHVAVWTRCSATPRTCASASSGACTRSTPRCSSRRAHESESTSEYLNI